MRKLAKNNKFAQKFSEESQNYSRQDNQENDDGYPIQLIQIKKTGEIKINQQAIQIIADADMPVGFVSLVGKMRTGKSYLMNKILNLNNNNGFKIDSSTNSCTKGIWMWSKPYQNNIHNNLIFFLDTQGTDSLQKDIESDTKIFTLAVLISSYFIYNSLGNIDQLSLSELEMITELSKQIKTGQQGQSKGENYHLHQHMPKFLWLLRDFVLKIQDNRGRTITATQYLENCLNESSSNGKLGQKSNKVKKSIMNFFIQRECLTMVRPTNDEQDLQNINKIPQYKIRRQFIDGVNKLKAMIMQNAGPKTYQSQPITGYGMCCMIQSYVQAFNKGKVPNIKSAWQQIDDSQGQHAYNKALQKFNYLISQQFANDQPKGQQIHDIMSQIKEQTLKQFEQHSYNNKNEKYYNLLKKILKQKQEEYLNTNNQMNQQKNIEILTQLSQGLKTKIQNRQYTSKNTDQLQKDIDEITKKYNLQAKGKNKGELLSEFVQTITPLVLNIKEDKTEEIQRIRQAQLRVKEQQQKIKRLQQQNQSKKKQIQAKDNANDIMNNKINKASKKDPKKDIPQSGCCAGGKCQIM